MTRINKRIKSWLLSSVLFVGLQSAFAAIYTLPVNGDSLIGQPTTTRVKNGDTVSSVARRYDLGFYELLDANPTIEPTKLKTSHSLVVPSRFILPNDAPREGIVINLAELRLYYFIPNSQQVFTAPVGIGRQDWDTPLGTLSVIEKRKNPTWHPTPAVRADVQKRTGVVLPIVMAAGPSNPLGNYMIRLSKPTYLIHGTNDPLGVGRRITAGCLRMYPEDIEALYRMVEVGTRVTIVNQPYKVGIANNKLYFEAHQPLVETRGDYTDELTPVWNHLLQSTLSNAHYAYVNWDRIKQVAVTHEGIPFAVAVVAPSQSANALALSSQPTDTVVATDAASSQPVETVAAADATPTSPAEIVVSTGATSSQPAETVAAADATPASPAETVASTDTASSQPAETVATADATPTSPAETVASTGAASSQPAETVAAADATSAQTTETS